MRFDGKVKVCPHSTSAGAAGLCSSCIAMGLELMGTKIPYVVRYGKSLGLELPRARSIDRFSTFALSMRCSYISFHRHALLLAGKPGEHEASTYIR